MTVVQDSLVDQISLDFARACIELARARLRLRERDDLTNRNAVALRRAEADAVLDMYLDMYLDPAPAAGPGSTRSAHGRR